MAFDTKLNELSASEVLGVEKILVTYVNEAFPDLDLTPGSVLRDVMVNLYAALEQRLRTEQATILKSNSLLEITANPSLADDSQVNRVLSNYNVVRSNGTKASGYVKFILDSDSTTLVPIGTKFTMGSLVFKTSSNVRAISSTESVLQTGDVNIIKGTGGSFFFNVPAQAAEPGSKYNIQEGTKVTGFSPKVSRVISAEAAQTMLGGKDSETNEELLAKLKQGVVGKILGGRSHIEAKLKAEFPYVISAGATGFGDPEMSRDTNYTLGTATGAFTVKAAATTANFNLKTLSIEDANGFTSATLFQSDITGNTISPDGTATVIGIFEYTDAQIADAICDAVNANTFLKITATPDPPVADINLDYLITLTQNISGVSGNTNVITTIDAANATAGNFTGGINPQAYHRGGTVDIHTRTAHYPLVETITVTATGDPATDIYEFTLTKEQCDGLYEVSQVNLPVAAGVTPEIGTLCIVEYDRTITLPTSGPSPSMSSGADLGFSAYQKVKIKVKDTTTSTTTVDYSVKLLKLPYIDVIQDYVAYGENRSVAADMVIKAAVPVFCGCNIRIVKPRYAPDIDVVEIQTAVANAVNAVQFGQPIPVSLIAHTAHKIIPAGAYVDLPISLFGNLYYPDKPKFADINNTGYSFGDLKFDNGAPDVKQLRTRDMLKAPYEPSRGVSSKTVAFFLNPYAVDVVVVEV